MDHVAFYTVLFVVIGLPITLGMGNEFFKGWLKHKELMATAMNAQAAEKAPQYAAHTDRLEQRVRVLERIATDRGADLAMMIDNLRDDQLPH